MASNSFRVVIWISFRFDVFRCALKRLKSCHWWGKDLLRWGQNLAIDGAPTKVHCSTRNRTTSLTQKNLNQPRKLDFFLLSFYCWVLQTQTYLLDTRLATQSTSPCLQLVEWTDSWVDRMRFESWYEIWVWRFVV